MSFVLRVFDAEEQRIEVHEVLKPAARIGRAEGNDVRLPSTYVSREHALIRRQGDGFLLESVGTNPTLLGGQPVARNTAVPVKPDQEILIGRYSIFIEASLEDSPEATAVERRLADLVLDLHARLLERVDLRATDTQPGGGADVRLRQALDELVRQRLAATGEAGIARDVSDHALRESVEREVLQEVLRHRVAEERLQRMQGILGRLDSVLAGVVQGLCRTMGLNGGTGDVHADLRSAEAAFPAAFEQFRREASPDLRALLVRRHLLREVLNLTCGFGPLQDLLEIPGISEIMVVDKDRIYVERAGTLERVHRSFVTDEMLVGVIQRIVDPLGRRIDRSTPMVDARLPDGSRVNAVIPPLAVRGPCLTIRRFSKDPITVPDLIRFGSLTAPAADFLRACVAARRNLLISGGTGSGKTTLLNVLSSFIAESERIVTIEDSAELQLRQPHVVTLETRPPNVEGKGAYSIRDLVRNALRMRPDRVIVGECRGAEALDMLQAMNTGHDGSLTTLHANSPEDALLRLETMVLEAADLPVRAIRDQIEAAIHVIVQTRRLPSGKRMVTHVAEVVGRDPADGSIVTNPIFEEEGGRLHFSGYLPGFMDALVAKGGLDPARLFCRETPAEAAR
jgi:Flp pilus assembly CpaF family ATPase